VQQVLVTLDEPGSKWVEAVRQAGVELAGRRLVLDTDLTGLNAALRRLMRDGLLENIETAVLLREPVRYLHSLGLPIDRDGQQRVAETGTARLVGVIKDDSGGVCVDWAAMSPWPADHASSGQDWWLRAVVDDQRLCDGTARSLSLRRISPSSLEATVRLGRFRKSVATGRSLQLACDDAQIVTDGVAREQPRSKRTFWSEPKLWRLALP